MAVGLVKAFGRYYDQILLVGDPLFFKRLTDHALEAGVDWHQHRVHAIVGEEIFGEHFRSYLGARLGSNLETFDGGYIMSSFGVGELGLHLGYETRTTIALRRAAHARPEFARELLGADTPAGDPLPMLFAFNPRRTFIEVCEPDQTGYGLMTTSMLEPERRLPLLRYQTGDIVALVDPDRAAVLAREHGIELPGPIPPALFALRGRDSEALPDGSHVGVHKDAAYSDPAVADRLTGAVRLIVEGRQITMHVQLVPGAEPTDDIAARLRARLGDTGVVVWPYAQFPFGMTLDYERKFACYVPGETAPARAPEPRRG
jgi:phenylacetate-CoA ligase